MAKLIISRSSEWMNRARGIKITINGNKIGKIANGQTREVELPAGDYVLKAKVDWCGGSFPFTISESETKSVTLSSFGYSWNFIPISTAFIVLVFVLQFLFKLDYAGYLGLPVLFVMVYYFTLGRNRYLVIKENSLLIAGVEEGLKQVDEGKKIPLDEVKRIAKEWHK